MAGITSGEAVTVGDVVDGARDGRHPISLCDWSAGVCSSGVQGHVLRPGTGVGPTRSDHVADVIGARGQPREAVATGRPTRRRGLTSVLVAVVVGIDEDDDAALARITSREAVTIGVVVDGARNGRAHV